MLRPVWQEAQGAPEFVQVADLSLEVHTPRSMTFVGRWFLRVFGARKVRRGGPEVSSENMRRTHPGRGRELVTN